MQVNEVKSLINHSATKGIPFLFAVDFELKEGFFIENPDKQDRILFRTPLGSNFTRKETGNKTASLTMHPESFEKYKKRFDIVSKGLKRGDSFLTNLTIKTPICSDLSLEEIALRSNSSYCLYIPGRFVCFSPECFVRIKDGTIATYPMKGTINADIPHAEEVLLSDTKEVAEHHTIVDLLRNDLGTVADNIQVNRFRYIDRIKAQGKEILQVSSEISGQLPDNYLSRLGDILFRMLPAGSVSGAPKKATLQIIQEAEETKRGFYSGIFGYFDGKELDSAVLIRYIEEESGQQYFRSGGGITASSNDLSEYKEAMEKIYLPFV